MSEEEIEIIECLLHNENNLLNSEKLALEHLLEDYKINNLIINEMAEQLTTDYHSTNWIKNYYKEKVEMRYKMIQDKTVFNNKIFDEFINLLIFAV